MQKINIEQLVNFNFEQYNQYLFVIWLVVGAFFLFLEASAAPGIGFIFAGLAAITVGGLSNFEIIDSQNILIQFLFFFLCTFLWAVILWVPLLKFRQKNMVGNFNNIVGDTAIIHSKKIEKNQKGKVSWSGTVMNAKISNTSPSKTLNKNDTVIIKAIEGNVLIVEPVSDDEDEQKNEEFIKTE